jgi:hypothetical protein
VFQLALAVNRPAVVLSMMTLNGGGVVAAPALAGLGGLPPFGLMPEAGPGPGPAVAPGPLGFAVAPGSGEPDPTLPGPRVWRASVISLDLPARCASAPVSWLSA